MKKPLVVPISAEIETRPSHSREAARALQERGFRVLRGGGTLSVDAPAALWSRVFSVEFVRGEVEGRAVARPGSLCVPAELDELIQNVWLQEPPELYDG